MVKYRAGCPQPAGITITYTSSCGGMKASRLRPPLLPYFGVTFGIASIGRGYPLPKNDLLGRVPNPLFFLKGYSDFIGGSTCGYMNEKRTDNGVLVERNYIR